MNAKETVKMQTVTTAPEGSKLGGAVAFSVFQNLNLFERD